MSSRQAPDAPVLAEEPRPPKQRKPIAVWVIGGLAVFWLLFGLAGGSFTGKLTEVQKNDNAAICPRQPSRRGSTRPRSNTGPCSQCPDSSCINATVG